MTVKEFIKQLEGLDPDLAVYLSADEEGNYYRPVVEAQESYFEPDDCEAIHPDDAAEYDEMPGKVVIIWP